MYVHWAHAYCDCRYEVENISIYLSIYLPGSARARGAGPAGTGPSSAPASVTRSCRPHAASPGPGGKFG